MELEEVRRIEGRSRGGRLRGGKVGGKHVHVNTVESNEKRTFGRRVADQFSSFYPAPRLKGTTKGRDGKIEVDEASTGLAVFP